MIAGDGGMQILCGVAARHDSVAFMMEHVQKATSHMHRLPAVSPLFGSVSSVPVQVVCSAQASSPADGVSIARSSTLDRRKYRRGLFVSMCQLLHGSRRSLFLFFPFLFLVMPLSLSKRLHARLRLVSPTAHVRMGLRQASGRGEPK